MRLILLVLFSILTLNVFAQSKQEKKANELYKDKHYAEAIPLYLEILKEKKSNSIRAKLAKCYHFLNQLEDAEKFYAEITTSPRVRPIHVFNYGKVLMGQGKYEEAKKIFNKYVEMAPDDPKGNDMLVACENVKNIQAKYKNVIIDIFPMNSSADDNSPTFYDGGIVFTSDRDRGAKVFKEKSTTTGRDFLYLYFSKKDNEGKYHTAELFSKKINVLNRNLGSATFSQDKNTIVFARNSDVISKNKSYNIQLYEATLTEGKWTDIKRLDFCSKEYNYMHPSLSPDNQTLYFVSDKGRGFGGTDIYVTRRTSTGWTRPENLGGTINTSSNEGFPFVDASGNLFFCSKGHLGLGGFDIFISQKEKYGWSLPMNLGKPINSSYDDISLILSSDGKSGAFTSSRETQDDNIYLFEINSSMVKSNMRSQVTEHK